MNKKSADLYKAIQSTDPKHARSTVRDFNTHQSEFNLFQKPFSEELSQEWKLFETFFRPRDDFPTIKHPCACLRYCVGLFFAAIGFPAFLLLLPTALVFLVYSWVYPVVELIRALIISDFAISSIATLPLCLTLAYLFTITLMLCLAPTIYTFSRLCTDIVPLGGSGLPPQFFDVAVVKQIETVFNAELSWQHLVS
jgi:hypothetical protein